MESRPEKHLEKAKIKHFLMRQEATYRILFRDNGYKNMAQAIRLVANDINKLYNMILA